MASITQQQFLDHAVAVLSRTDGVVGVAIGGSWLVGDMDEFSDLDLVVVLDPAAAPARLAERPALAARLGRLLACFTGEHVGELRLLICLYDEPLLHVDLKFVTPDGLSPRIEEPRVLWQRGSVVSGALAATGPAVPIAPPTLQWVEDRFWVWVHYAATKIGRGELLETVSFLDFLRTTVFGPLLAQRHGLPVRGVRRLEQNLPPAELAWLTATVAPAERAGCLRALRQAATGYRDLRAALRPAGFQPHELAERRALAYLAEVESRGDAGTPAAPNG